VGVLLGVGEGTMTVGGTPAMRTARKRSTTISRCATNGTQSAITRNGVISG